MVKPSPEDLLTPSDAARVIGMSVDSVRILADSGKIPMQRTTNGRRFFRRADVDTFAAKRRSA